MGETVKSLLAMVRTHSAITKPSKAHMVVGKVDYDIIDGCSSKWYGLDYLLLHYFAFGEYIACKWMTEISRIRENFIKLIPGDNRNYRAENFFLHYWVVKGDTCKNSGFNA